MSRKLETIQTEDRLNNVFAVDEIGPGGANHEYVIENNTDEVSMQSFISFQKGPRNEEGSVLGVLDVDLLEIVRDRLKAFQAGDYACEENARALTGVEQALEALNERVINRKKRGVFGTNNK